MSARLKVREITKEVERPPGGSGKGQEALYIGEVMLDGHLAFKLQAHNFQQPGQFADFCAIVNTQSASPGAVDPLPMGMSRPQAIAALRAYRKASLDYDKERAARGEPKKEQVPARWPIDALLDFIETCGFPPP